MTKPTILLDVDGVMVHMNQAHLDHMNGVFGTQHKHEDITTFNYDFLPYEMQQYMYYLWNSPTLYDNYHLGQEELTALEEMRSFARVVACTAPMEGHVSSKYRFLRRYFEKPDIFLCHDKTMVKGDLLVDDAIHNIKVFPGNTIIYTQPWNLDYEEYRFTDEDGRVDTFSQIPNLAKDILL